MPKKLSFAIVGEADSKNTQDLVREIESRGHKATVFQLSRVQFAFRDGAMVPTLRGKRVDQHDVYLFRAYNRNFFLAQMLADALVANGKVVIDKVLTKRLIPSKVYEAAQFVKHGVPHPATYQIGDKGSYPQLLQQLKYSVIAKPIYGQQGQDMQKLDSRSAAGAFFRKHPDGYFLQQYIPATSDIRVSVVGGKAYGALRRFVIKGDFRTNTSLGARVEETPLTPELRRLAVKATRAVGYDVAGVDIIGNGKKLYVLEVNATPQWQNIKKIIGINLAEVIIDYALKQYAKS